jgi:Family of unknown function (DUF6152)
MKYVALILSLLGLQTAAFAHHSFPAQYDVDKPITLTVKVTEVEWTNPHIFIHGTVTDANGASVDWLFEMGGPNALIRKGWKRDSLKPQDIVVIEGSLARDGSNLVNARTVTMQSTGRKMFAGSSGGDEAPAPKPSTNP